MNDYAAYLFALPAAGLQERIQARRDTLQERVTEAVATVATSDKQWMGLISMTPSRHD